METRTLVNEEPVRFRWWQVLRRFFPFHAFSLPDLRINLLTLNFSIKIIQSNI